MNLHVIFGAGATVKALVPALLGVRRRLTALNSAPEVEADVVNDNIAEDILPAGCFVRENTDLASRAMRMLIDLRRRESCFEPAIVGDVPWEMLLLLYVRESSALVTQVRQLLEESGVPPSTRSRWLDLVEAQGLIIRHKSSSEQKTELVKLSVVGRSALDKYLAGCVAEEKSSFSFYDGSTLQLTQKETGLERPNAKQ